MKERLSYSKLIADQVTHDLGYNPKRHLQLENKVSLQIHLGEMEKRSRGLDPASERHLAKLYRKINKGPLNLRSVLGFSAAALLAVAITTPLVLDHVTTRSNALNQRTEALAAGNIDRYAQATNTITDIDEWNSLPYAATGMGIAMGGMLTVVLASGAIHSRRKPNPYLGY